jgi:hypothetical protein
MTSKRDTKEQVYFSKGQHDRLLAVTNERAEDRSAFIRRIVMDEVNRLLLDKEKESLKLQVLRSMGGGLDIPDLSEMESRLQDAS